MKKFIVMVLGLSVFFIGLGNLAERVGAKFKSDEKALELVRKARQAVGGDSAVASVKSMTILGKTTKTFDVEGALRSEQGDTEINFELPNKMSRMTRLGSGEAGGNQMFDKKVDVVVVTKGDGDNVQWKTQSSDAPNGDGVKKIIVRKSDGTTEELKTDSQGPILIRKGDGNENQVTVTTGGGEPNGEVRKIILDKADQQGGGEIKFRTNELFRTALSLLLTVPEGLDVAYTYVGEGTVDGASCDIISASDGGPGVKLYLDKSTSQVRMMTYQAPQPFMVRFKTDGASPDASGGDVKIFTRTAVAPDMAEFQVKFSDFRSVNGLQLPFKWTQTVGGKDDETTDITSYDVNPANIADKFKEMPPKVILRTKKEQ